MDAAPRSRDLLIPDRIAPFRRRAGGAAPLLLLIAVLGGCQTGAEELMVTPAIYEGAELEPFSHVPPHRRRSAVSVYYATHRAPEGEGLEPEYGTEVSPELRLGKAEVGFGEPPLDWEGLSLVSLEPEREDEVPIRLESVREIATLDPDGTNRGSDLTPEQARFRDMIEADLEHAVDRDVLIYVHGANASFYRCTARTAELAHFAGRDLPCIVFDWPSHPNILSYVVGSDPERAEAAAGSLAELVRFLAENTTARRVHILCYSAGGVVTSSALAGLRRAEKHRPAEQLRDLYRLGVVVFAAADVPLETFLDEFRDIHDISERLTITVSDADYVLGFASTVLGGGERLGMEPARLSEEERILLHELPRVEILDVSSGKEERGFDIAGHTYWYKHPWVLSEIILNVRTDVPPAERALVPTDCERFWALPPDYPELARRAAFRLLPGWRQSGAPRTRAPATPSLDP